MRHIILNIVILLLASTAVLSCSTGMPGTLDPDARTLVISGVTTDSSTDEPLEDVKITLQATEVRKGVIKSKRTVTAYTDNRGSYNITAEGFRNTVTCSISAEDMKGNYQGGTQEINISWSGPSYEKETGTFYVNDCNFYLGKTGK
jgi:hypothetical protein